MSAESSKASSTSRCADRCVLIWKIDGLADEGVFQSPTKTINSPMFCIPGGGSEFSVRLQTRLKPSTTAEGFIDLTLLYVKGPDTLVFSEFYLIDEPGEKTFIRYFFGKLCQSGSWSCENFITRSEMMDQKLKLFRNNEVTVACVVTLWEEAKPPKWCEQRAESLHSTDSSPDTCFTFYRDPNHPGDIQLKVGGQSIVANKALLMRRSPVFAAILEDNSMEVAIEDVESDVFVELLRYMYTDNFAERSVGFVAKLLAAANRYDVESLKTLCTDYLKVQVDPDNVLEVLKSTELCPSEELENKCLDLVEREMSTSLVDCMKKMKDLPQIICLLKKRFVDDDSKGVQSKRQCSR